MIESLNMIAGFLVVSYVGSLYIKGYRNDFKIKLENKGKEF